jgi:2-oxoglutarate ferredoxin oxidoreductase subunit alpha
MTEEQRPDWAVRGAQGRKNRILTSLNLTPEGLEQANLRLQARLATVQRNEVRWEEEMTEDAELLLVAFGTMGRICKTVLRSARRAGVKVGLLRPISLWPFPEQRLFELAGQVQQMLVVEMNAGQMLLDVQAAVRGRAPIRFYGRMGGMVPLPDEISEQIDKLMSLPANQPDLSRPGNGYHGNAAASAVTNHPKA